MESKRIGKDKTESTIQDVAKLKEVVLENDAFGQPLTRQPWYVVLLPSLAFAGVQLAWGVQIGHTSAHLRHMGLSDRLVGLAWLAGPVSGIVVQPIVGVLSDRCRSRLGRRRPFMLAGALLVTMSLLLFAFSAEIAERLGDPVNPNGGGSPTGLAIALLSFWVLDFNINVLQSPTRALLADIVPSEQVPMGNAFFAVANGFGKTSAYVVGSITPDIRIVNVFAAGFVMLFSFLPALLARGDRPPPAIVQPEEEPSRQGLCSALCKTFREVSAALRLMPRGIRQVFVVQFFSYLSFMIVFIYVSIFFGQLLGGSPDAPKGSLLHNLFQDGVILANKALLIMSILSMVAAPLVPVLARMLGTRLFWGGSLAVMGVAFVCTLFRPNSLVAVLIVASIALPLSNAMTIPWAITALSTLGQLSAQRGLYFSIFNLSQAVPGLFSSLLGSLAVHVTNGDLSAPLVVAGVTSLIGALFTISVDVPIELNGIALDETEPLDLCGD